MSEKTYTIYKVASLALPLSFVIMVTMPELVQMSNVLFVTLYDHFLRFRTMMHG